jgi:hypothetical protein
VLRAFTQMRNAGNGFDACGRLGVAGIRLATVNILGTGVRIDTLRGSRTAARQQAANRTSDTATEQREHAAT